MKVCELYFKILNIKKKIFNNYKYQNKRFNLEYQIFLKNSLITFLVSFTNLSFCLFHFFSLKILNKII